MKNMIIIIYCCIIIALTSCTLNTVRLVPYQMKEYIHYAGNFDDCAKLESYAEANGVTNSLQKECRSVCGKRNMDYAWDTCEKNVLVCYCRE
jgi:hypothetical protein